MAHAGVNRAIRRPLILAVGGILVAGYAAAVRPRLLKWGATSEEVAASYPGDDLIALPTDGATMATTLPAPPATVWPWLVQMGGDRGGWYGWDWLDNAGHSSATTIHPEWQQLQLGQHLARVPRGPANWFTVVVLVPERTLVLRAEYNLLTGQPLPHDPDRGHVAGIWGFHLRPTDDEPYTAPSSVPAAEAARPGSLAPSRR